MLTVTIVNLGSEKVLMTTKVQPSTNIHSLKEKLCSYDKKYKYNRISLRLEPRAKMLENSFSLSEIKDSETSSDIRLYYKDLGPQVGWSTVFYLEYTGPLIIYLIIWGLRQPGVGVNILSPIRSDFMLRKIACVCYVGHFTKRVLETCFVHRFSHATMPIGSLLRNCLYYWLFAFLIAYFTNHPLYTPPAFGHLQFYTGLGLFLVGELGNLACHLALRNLRPSGSTIRKLPQPVTGSPLTFLFKYVACPNYTYETLSWIGFSLMTQTLPALVFTTLGFWTMAQWARTKLRAYRTEFPACPKHLKAIVPLAY